MREDKEGKAMDRSDFACNEDIRERKCIRHMNVHTVQENVVFLSMDVFKYLRFLG